MNKFNKIFLLLGVLIFASNLNAQNMSDMRLNEILVTNTNGYIDDYGNRSGWIELFNTSYGTVDIGGCYITDDPNNLKKYVIPKADVLTKVKPRQHILFFADSLPDKGTFHINFKLEQAKKIIFVSSDGRTIIDAITLPNNLPADCSFGRLADGVGSAEPVHFMRKSYNIAQLEANQGENGGWGVISVVTPSTNNVIDRGGSRSVIFLETDPTGAIMALTAMSVVFLALIMLTVVFKLTGNHHIKKSEDNAKKVIKDEAKAENKIIPNPGETSAEVYASIAMALHLFMVENEAHDFEHTILTINKVSKSYSPWSSKIYSLRETPQLKK